MKTNKVEGLKADLKINADTSKVDEALEKIERLHELIKEANSLVDELANKEINIKLSINESESKPERIEGLKLNL